MVFTTRSPVALAAVPSSTPYEVMAASQQAHIDELVQKNRTDEYTIKKLQQTLDEEKERGIEVVNRLKVVSMEERSEWREGCDSLLASHRIVHLRTKMELEKEKTQVLSERSEISKERLAVLHRDFKLTLFQAKEVELENRVAEFEEALGELREQRAEDTTSLVGQKEEAVAVLTTRISKMDALRKQAENELEAVQTEKAVIQNELSTLRDAHAALTVSAASTSTKLERSTLQLEGAKSATAELEHANGELKRANSDIKRQLDKWQNLETRGGTEMEEVRKRKIELEVQVKELQVRVKELERGEKDIMNVLEKERKKVEKLNERIQGLTELAEEAQDIAAQAQSEATQKDMELALVRSELDGLHLQQQSESKQPKDLKGKRKQVRKPPPPSSDVESVHPPASEREVEIAITPLPQPNRRVRPKPAYRGPKPSQETAHEGAKAEESDTDRRPQKNMPRKGMAALGISEVSAKKRKKVSQKDGSGDEGLPKLKGKEKAKATYGNEEAESNISRANFDPSKEDSETGNHDKRSIQIKGRNKRRHDSDEEDVSDGKGKPSSKAKTAMDVAQTVQKSKPSSRSDDQKTERARASRGRAGNDVEEVLEEPKKKKKRIFSASQPLSFTWNALPQVDGGLNIPTELSPVKESDLVPARSVFGRMGSALGWQ